MTIVETGPSPRAILVAKSMFTLGLHTFKYKKSVVFDVATSKLNEVVL